ncbi:MAG: response regulator [Planctomycetaceae bacterium]|nr:response regulator [Planctomycetaceae bacterium]
MSWILACDDHAHITRLIELTLRKRGWNVVACADGLSALGELARRPNPELIITDFQMPKLDGLGLIREVLEQPALRDVPVILLTAKAFELSEQRLQSQLGIACMLKKPFSPRQLLALVEQLTQPAELMASAQ